MKLTKRILCVVCALAMLLVAMPVAQMMTSAETASIGWNVMFDWENEGSHGDIVTTTATTAKDQKTTIGVREIDQYTGTATDFTFIEGSKKAVWFYNSKANISSSAPSTGEAPATIDLVPAQLEKATDLRVNLHKKPTTYTTENIYFGAVIGGVTYYHILDKAAYTTNAAYFSFVGQTLTSLADGSTKTVTAADIPNFTKLAGWVETEGYSALLIDNVEYYGEEVEAPTTTTVPTTASTTKKVSVFDNTIYKLEARSADCTSKSTITNNADGSISIQFPDDVRSTQNQIQFYTDHLDKDAIIAAGNKMKVDFTLDECWTNTNYSTDHASTNVASFKSVNLGGNFSTGDTKYAVGKTYTAEVDMSSVDWTKNNFVQLMIENYQNVMLGTDVTFMLYVEKEDTDTTTTTEAATTEATTTEAATTEAATTEAATTATEPSFDRNLNLYNDKKPLKVESAYADQTANSTFVVTEKGSVKITFPAATRAQQYQIQYDLTKLDKAAIEAAGNKLVVTMTGYGSWLKPDGSADGTHTKINVGGVLKAGSDSGSWLKGGNSVTYTLDMTDVDYSKGTMAVIAQNYYGSGLTNVVIEVYLSVPEKVDTTTTTTATDATTTTAPAEEWVVGQYAPSNGIFTNTATYSSSRIAKTAKMDVTAGKAYKFDTGCEDEGIKFIIRGYSADGTYVDLSKTSVGAAVFVTGDVIVIPEGVAQISISMYDVNDNGSTRGQELLDMIAAGTLVPTITETTEVPTTTTTTTQPTQLPNQLPPHAQSI